MGDFLGQFRVLGRVRGHDVLGQFGGIGYSSGAIRFNKEFGALVRVQGHDFLGQFGVLGRVRGHDVLGQFGGNGYSSGAMQ